MIRLPLRLRLTLAFGSAMVVLIVVLGAFMYERLADELLASVDTGLRSRAQIVADAIGGADEGRVVAGAGGLIDPDEAIAQVLASRARSNAHTARPPFSDPGTPDRRGWGDIGADTGHDTREASAPSHK